MKWYIKLFRFIWEFPQCLLGLILILCYRVKKQETYEGINIYAGNFPGGISLGLFILMGSVSYKYNRDFIKQHEYGHTRQSLYLGPLYLLVVGLPSIIWAWRFIPNSCMGSYYQYWTERWADKLGNVSR